MRGKLDYLKYQTKSTYFSLISNKNKYYEIIIQSELDSIMIKAIEKNTKEQYYENYSLESLKNYLYLSLFETIDEIFEEIKDKISKKSPKLFEEKNTLNLVIETGNTKFKEIKFLLKNDKLNELYIIIDELKSKEKTQETKIKFLEDSINKLQIDKQILFQKNEILEKEIEKIKKRLNKISNRNRYNIRYNNRYSNRYRNRYRRHHQTLRQLRKRAYFSSNNDSKSINNNIKKLDQIEDEKKEKENKKNKKSKLAMILDEVEKGEKRTKASEIFKNNQSEKGKKINK